MSLNITGISWTFTDHFYGHFDFLSLLKILKTMRIHFIAIGGSAMHNLALALHQKGYHITGSDDMIYEPSRSRLEKNGLLPEEIRLVSGKNYRRT